MPAPALVTDEPPVVGGLARALAEAQGEIEDPTRSKSGQVAGRRDYRYAGLDDLLKVIRPALSKHGLAVTQTIDAIDGNVFLRTRLMHVGGEEVSSLYPLSWSGTPQQHGSELTYARRYSLEAIVGVAATDDDDGADAEAPAAKSKPTRKPKPSREEEPPRFEDEPPPDARTPTSEKAKHHVSWDGDRSRFFAVLAEEGYENVRYEDLAAFCESLGMPRPSAMTGTVRQKLLDRLATDDGKAKFWAWQRAEQDRMY